MIDILSDSSGGPNMLKVRGAMIAQTLQQKKSEQVTVSVATMRKDMRAMLDQAKPPKQLPLTSMALHNSMTPQKLAWMTKTARNYPFGGLQRQPLKPVTEPMI
jgi:hypothetical protein